jgi:UDP-N-acetylglucosamine--N-acetylmuramyl-(pentapeptide) pyrophosphoryl-undecaprenol N-acetylglucosamine transferase
MPDKSLKIIITGGGTGGHLFPGIAIAQEFIDRDEKNQVIFISTGRPVERLVLPAYGFKLKIISAEGLKGRGIFRQIQAIWKLMAGFIQSMSILKKFQPHMIIGMGSYSAAPMVLAAWIFRQPVFLCEQNIFPGITNRMLSIFAKRVFVSFPDTQKIHLNKMMYTGNPVRKELVNSFLPQPDNFFTVLVLGGSQGAHRINTAIMEALKYLDEIRDLRIIHQTGPTDETIVRKSYEQSTIHYEVNAFFNDMARIYRLADLVLCRSGATTIAELTAMGKPAIFIPFPHAADNHQKLNARAICNRGAAEMILQKNLSGKILADKIIQLALNRQKLTQMGKTARQLGKPEAAATIVENCYRIINE